MAETKKTPQPHRFLYRSEKDRVIGGVAGGIAAYFEVDPNLVRFLFILITLLGGSGILLYVILWILLPSESSPSKNQEETVKRNLDEIKGMAEHMADEIKPHAKRRTSREWFAVILIVIGALFLLQNFGLLWWFSMAKFWPVILILLGVGVLFGREDKS